MHGHAIVLDMMEPAVLNTILKNTINIYFKCVFAVRIKWIYQPFILNKQQSIISLRISFYLIFMFGIL